MLKLFRDNLKSLSIVLWFVIAVFVLLVFAEVGVFTPSAVGGPNAPAATADEGISVTFAEYERAYRPLESSYRQRFGDNFTPQLADQIKLQAVNQALDFKILLLEARKLGLQVSDEELRETVLGYFRDENGNFVGEELYRRALRSNGFSTPSEFEEFVREDLLRQKLVDVMRSSVFVSSEEIEDLFRQRTEQAKVRYLRVRDSQFADQVEITQSDLETYYQEHTAELQLPEQRSVNYLLVDKVQLRDQIEIPQEEIQAYYDDNRASFSTEEQVRARHILVRTEERSAEEAQAMLEDARRRIEAGEDFGAVAREVSEDPGSRENGGDLRFFARGRMVPEFEEAAFSAELNQLVGPIQSPFGFHLLEVTDRRDGGLRPLDEVLPQIRTRLLADRLDTVAEERAGELVARLKDLETPTAEALREVADELDYVTLNNAAAFSRQGLIPGVGRSAEFSDAAFSLEPGTLSDPVQVPRGWAVLLVEEIQEPRMPELAEVENQIRQEMRLERQHELATQRIEEAKSSLASGASFETVASELGVETRESELFNAAGTLPDLGPAGSKVIGEALEMDEGAVGGPVDVPQGVALYQVTERVRMDPSELEGQSEQLREQLENEKFRRLLTATLAQRHRDLNVEYTKSFLDRVEVEPQGI
jgi:peptidyl-prolyl cis-trans isomerase D